MASAQTVTLEEIFRKKKKHPSSGCKKILIIGISKDRETKAATLWLQYWNPDIWNRYSFL